MNQNENMDHTLAVFIDFENLAIGFQDTNQLSEAKFSINKILERLVEKGKIIVKKAYADWGQYKNYKRNLHEFAIELIEIPKRSLSGKNSADIHLCVDAMDLCYSKVHINTFVIVSGDSDFSPLVSKLKENGKRVIGVGMKKSTSELLIGNCDEFIYYEDLEQKDSSPPRLPRNTPKIKREGFQLLINSTTALMRENKEILWSSMIKDTMKRKSPSFSESAYGYRNFSELLEDAEKRGLVSLRIDQRSGTYVVTGFGNENQKKKI